MIGTRDPDEDVMDDSVIAQRKSTAVMKSIHDDIKDTIAKLGWDCYDNVAVEIAGERISGNSSYWPIQKDGVEIGKITSSAYSLRYEKNLAIAMVAIEHTDLGTTFDIMMPDGVRKGTVSDTPKLQEIHMTDTLYPIGTLPPLGEVPKKMYAQVIRQDRFGDPLTAFQEEVIDIQAILIKAQSQLVKLESKLEQVMLVEEEDENENNNHDDNNKIQITEKETGQISIANIFCFCRLIHVMT